MRSGSTSTVRALGRMLAEMVMVESIIQVCSRRSVELTDGEVEFEEILDFPLAPKLGINENLAPA